MKRSLTFSGMQESEAYVCMLASIEGTGAMPVVVIT
jgi:hypothetical protein